LWEGYKGDKQGFGEQTLKKKILIISGVLVLLLGILIILPNLVDWNKFKPQFADGVKAATGQTITIDGDLKFKLLPSPALTASNVSLANIPGGIAPNFVELQGLDLRLKLWPLFSGDLQITSLVLEGGKIFLERDAEGRANWEVLFTAEAESGDQERQVTLESFILRDTTISYIDVASDTREAVEAINADLVVTSLSGPYRGEGDLIYRAIPIAFEIAAGEFSEGATVPLDLILIPSGDGPGLAFDGSYVEEGGIAALSGNLGFKGKNAENLVLLLSRLAGIEAVPAGDWKNAYSGKATVLALKSEDKTEIDLDDLSLTLGKMTATGALKLVQDQALNATVGLEIDTLNIDKWLAGDEEAELEFPEGVTAALDLKIKQAIYRAGPLDDVTFLAKLEDRKLSIEKLQAAIPGNTSLTLYGTLEARGGPPVFDGNVDLESRTFRTLLDWLEVDHSSFPRNRLSRFSFSGKVRMADPVLEVEKATIGLDSTRFSGGMTLDLEKITHFAIVGSLNNLDIDSYFPAAAGEGEAQTLAERVQNLKQTLKDLSDYNGFISLRAETLKAIGANIRGVVFKGTIDGGVLGVQQLVADAFEGAAMSFNGRIGAEGEDISFDATLTVSSANLSTIMRWAAVENPFEERVIPAGNLNARMRGTLARAAAGLTGQFSGIDFEASGQINDLVGEPSFDITIKLAHASTVELIRKFTPAYFPARTPLGPFSLTAGLSGKSLDYTLAGLNLQLGPAAIQGDIRVRERAGRTFYGGNLTTRNIVLDDFMAPVDAGLKEVIEKGGERWSDDQWDVAFLRENDLDVTVGADSLNFRTYRFLNPKARLASEGGILKVENLTAGFFGGSFATNITMDARETPKLDIKLDMKGVSTEQALRASADITRLTGTMSLNGAFTGTGFSQREFISTFSGSATVSTKDGVIKGIDLPKLSKNVENVSAIEALGTILTSPFRGGQTAYRFIRSEIGIKNGVARFGTIESDVDSGEIGGKGVIDLAKWLMDVSGGIKLKDHPTLPAIGVNMKGRIDEPDVSFDVAPVRQYLMKELQNMLFQKLLKTPKQPQPVPEGQGGEGIPPAATPEQQTEPTLEEQIFKGLADILGGGEEEEEPEEGDDEGGGGGSQ